MAHVISDRSGDGYHRSKEQTDHWRGPGGGGERLG